MKIEISVPVLVNLFKEMQEQPKRLFKMIRVDFRESVCQCLTKMMGLELTEFLGRNPYERAAKDVNHRNGSYDRRITLKGIDEVPVKLPKNGNGAFKTQIIPRSKQY